MCIIADKIKLCTCKASSTNRLQNYWVLHRRNKEKNIMIVGEVMLPSFEWFHPKEYKKNYVTLENRVNEGDVFDVPMVFKAKDVLELVFNNNDDIKRATYGFKYFNKKWIKSEICPFNLSGYFDEVQFGKIKRC
jgi:hypothetical protein